MTADVKQLYKEIASDEGKVLHPYLCTEGHATIGIGHKILNTDPEINLPIKNAYDGAPEEDCITEHRCYELFQEDVQIAIDGCRRIYDNWEKLPQEAQHVLVNMCFQMGPTGLSKFKHMNQAIEDQAWGQVALEMHDSKWSRQTPERSKRLRLRMLALADRDD